MKKFLFIISTVLIFLSMSLLNSCERDTSLQNKTFPIKIKESVMYNEMFTFPVETELSIEGKSLNFVLPDGYKLITLLTDKDENERVKSFSKSSVSCECLAGKGCDPYMIGNQSGCSTDGTCSRCLMQIEKGAEKFYLKDAQIVNFNKPERFFTDEDDFQNIPSPKPFIFKDKDVLEHFYKFIEGHTNESDIEKLKGATINKIPEGYVMVPTEFLGKLIVVGMKKQGILGFFLDDSKGYNCSCGSGSGCTYESTWTPKGTIHYCSAEGCSKCTLQHEQ
ncbi:MAG: hypothetical protein DRI94_07985 [Bacteroidetes bacterium]|nr:MAG: hypothetical protein DRI94_07985 [Bacteroidota bacterium]